MPDTRHRRLAPEPIASNISSPACGGGRAKARHAESPFENVFNGRFFVAGGFPRPHGSWLRRRRCVVRTLDDKSPTTEETLSTNCNTGSPRSLRAGTARRCCPRHAALPARCGSSPPPNTACASGGECHGPSSRQALWRARISVSSSFPSATAMSQKSSLMKMPQPVPQALTLDTCRPTVSSSPTRPMTPNGSVT